MTAATTPKRILDAAEWVFAESGYSGASIRSITSMAGTDMGAVRYHFGNKDALFGEVLRRRLVPLCAERMRMLELVTHEAGSARPEIERLIEAFLVPAIRLVTHEGYGRSWRRLMCRMRVEPDRYLDSVQTLYTDLLRAFLDAFRKALPELPEDEIAYRVYFMFGTQIHALMSDGTLRALGPDLDDMSADPGGVLERIVRFVAAGMRAPCPCTGDLERAARPASAQPTGSNGRPGF